MLYYLFDYLNDMDFPGAGLFQYLSFRAAFALITSLVISMVFGKKIINILRKKQIGETVRELGLAGEKQKQGTPTMGGLIIIASIIIPVLLFGNLTNTYVILMIVTTLWLGIVGFADDYIKVFKKNKEGLAGKTKIAGQVVLGIIVGLTLYFSNDVVVRDIQFVDKNKISIEQHDNMTIRINETDYITKDHKSTVTTLPFVKNNEADYSNLLWFLGKEKAKKYSWIVFVFAVILIITAVSNGANLTDGMDGLATSTSAIIGTTLGVFAYLSGNIIFANYLKIMYIPFAGELVIFASAFIGATIGFLWYNSYPAQVFMGDTGSLAIGGIIAVFAIIIRKELMLPLLCGIYLIESLSVMIQVFYFKYTKKKFGEGRRVFLMAPIHHHFHKKGYHEAKIVTRFMIVGVMLAVLTVVTLKVR
jgi:phospho-N-acetylmuramoyl-pentapeptide-transferase